MQWREKVPSRAWLMFAPNGGSTISSLGTLPGRACFTTIGFVTCWAPLSITRNMLRRMSLLAVRSTTRADQLKGAFAPHRAPSFWWR
jgi:hypothetical protein